MNWKSELYALEKRKAWDDAINLLEDVSLDDPANVEASLAFNYLLMNLLVEENYDDSKHDCYVKLLKDSFECSYKQFSKNAEYLFFTGITACMSEWYFDISLQDAEEMIKKAAHLEPDNILYSWGSYKFFKTSDKESKEALLKYAELVLMADSPIKKILDRKGSLGEYVWELMTYWAKKEIAKNLS